MLFFNLDSYFLKIKLKYKHIQEKWHSQKIRLVKQHTMTVTLMQSFSHHVILKEFSNIDPDLKLFLQRIFLNVLNTIISSNILSNCFVFKYRNTQNYQPLPHFEFVIVGICHIMKYTYIKKHQFSSVQSLSRIQLFATP